MKSLLLTEESGPTTPGYATLDNTVGMGDVSAPSEDTIGSGDKFVELGKGEMAKAKKKEKGEKEYMKNNIMTYEQFVKSIDKNQQK